MAARVGLTGGIGSGKSTVAKLFAGRGVLVVDADAVARDVTLPGTRALVTIVSRFGDRILTADGRLDRAALGREIFASADQRRWLERLLHPLIRREMDTQASNCTDPYCILEIPLLVETGRQEDMDCVIAVHCPREVRIARLSESRGMCREDVERVMDQQITDEARLDAADYALDNGSDPEALKSRFIKVFMDLERRFS